jgi:hypothetical protein
MPKTLDITRILREQKEQLRAGFQDRLVMTASKHSPQGEITLGIRAKNIIA